MPFNRITPEEIAASGVVAAPDRMIGKPADNKAVFDRLSREVVVPAFNALLDALEASTGANGLGAEPFDRVAGETVQQQIKDVEKNVEDNHDFLATEDAAEYLGAKKFGNLVGATVQAQLRCLLGLHEALKKTSGAAYVGAVPFNGVPSSTVQGQIADVQQNVDDINSGIIPTQSVTMEKLGLDVVERIEAPVVSHTSTELDDYAAEVGVFSNAGAGWNTYRFREPFEAAPVVVVCPQGFSGWVEVKEITATGFLYCLRRPKLGAGEVASGSFYVANGTGTSPSHAAQTLLTGVTFPALTTETVADGVQISYQAFESGGER